MKFKICPKTLGLMLSEMRQKAGLSQAKISKICDVNSPQYISNIERGQCLPSAKILKVMLKNYKLSMKDQNRLIDTFMSAAQSEIQEIFSVELVTNHSIKKNYSNGSYSIGSDINMVPFILTAVNDQYD